MKRTFLLLFSLFSLVSLQAENSELNFNTSGKNH